MKLELSDGQRSLNLLSGGSIYAVQEGFDLPLPGRDVTYIEPVDGEGRRRIRSKDTNGEGRIQAMISGTTDANFWDNVDNLLELVQSAHRNRGSITYTPPGGSDEITWDLEAVTVTGLPQKGQQLATRRAECEIAFETRPYGKLSPSTINLAGTVAAKTLSGPIDYAEIGGIAGQIEAFADLKLTDTSGQERRHVEIGVQDVFDPADPEPLLLTAGTMAGAGGTLQAFSGVAGTTSAPANAYTTSSGDSYVIRSAVPTQAVTVLGTGKQPHYGLWKVRARVNCTDTGIRFRLVWKVGEGQFTKEQWRLIPRANAWIDLDLGTIDISKLEAGHTWEGRIEAIGQVGYAFASVDFLTLQPADRYLRLRGVQVAESTTSLFAGDDFQVHAAGTLNGKTPPLTPGGNWVSTGGTGDFQITQSASKIVSRAGTADANPISGRYGQFGTAVFSDIEVSADLLPFPNIAGTFIDYPGATSGTLGDFSRGQAGVFLRYVDSSNHIKAFYTRNVYERQVDIAQSYSITTPAVWGTPVTTPLAPLQLITPESTTTYTAIVRTTTRRFEYLSLHLQKVMGGTVTSLGRVDFGPGDNLGGAQGNRRMRILAGTAGDIEVWEGPLGAELSRQITYSGDADLATGGTLDEGTFGLYHANTGATRDTTTYYSIIAQDPSTSAVEPAIRANNSVEVTHSAAYTLAGTAEVKALTPIREGEYLKLSPATRNQGKSRIVVRARREDPELGSADTGVTDQVEARLEVTPRVTLQ